MNAIERLRAGIGTGDRLVPGTMSQEEADALEALRAVDALYQAAKTVAPKLIDGSYPGRNVTVTKAEIDALAAAVRRVDGDA